MSRAKKAVEHAFCCKYLELPLCPKNISIISVLVQLYDFFLHQLPIYLCTRLPCSLCHCSNVMNRLLGWLIVLSCTHCHKPLRLKFTRNFHKDQWWQDMKTNDYCYGFELDDLSDKGTEVGFCDHVGLAFVQIRSLMFVCLWADKPRRLTSLIWWNFVFWKRPLKKNSPEHWAEKLDLCIKIMGFVFHVSCIRTLSSNTDELYINVMVFSVSLLVLPRCLAYS